VERSIPKKWYNPEDGTSCWRAWDTEKFEWAIAPGLDKYKTRKSCQLAIKENFHTRYKMPDEIFNAISDLCDQCKIDWFYNEYRDRKTIDNGDLKCLLDAFYAACALPPVLKDWLSDNNVAYEECPNPTVPV